MHRQGKAIGGYIMINGLGRLLVKKFESMEECLARLAEDSSSFAILRFEDKGMPEMGRVELGHDLNFCGWSEEDMAVFWKYC